MNFDNIFEKAKDVFETAYRKTEGAVAVQKQKFDVSSMESKLCKSYEELGRACFGMIADGGGIDLEALKPITDEIAEKQTKIEEAKRELMKTRGKRACKSCGEMIDKNSVFCKTCGAKTEEQRK